MPRRDEAEIAGEFDSWEEDNADYEKMPPADWWEDELTLVTQQKADQLNGALERLVTAGCSRGELLGQLRTISGIANLTQIPRRDLVAYRDAVNHVADRLHTFAMTQVGPALTSVPALWTELAEHLRQIDSFLKRSEKIAHPYLREAEEEFNRDVHYHAAGAQHADVAMLLQFVTRKRKTQGAQRMATSRANRVKPMTKKMKVQVKRTQEREDRGWEELRKRQKAAKAVRRDVDGMAGLRISKRP